MAPARFLADLTADSARALVRCHTLVVLVGDPTPKGEEPKPGSPESFGIHPHTLRALIGRGLVEQRRDSRMRLVWKPTATGVHVIQTASPRYPAARSQHGYTTEPSLAMFPDAGESVDELTQKRLSDEGRARDHARDAGVDDLLLVALATLRIQRHELARIAHERGVDIRDSIRRLDRVQNTLEQQIRQQAANARSAA